MAGDGPIGEAWLLSDRDDHPSLVANGPLKGWTITQLLKQSPQQLLGKWAGRFNRFPLLLKFLDVRKSLSVQVHPTDSQTSYLPPGESGKTEAWVVLEAGPESRIYDNVETLKAAIHQLEQASHALSQALYATANAQADASAAHARPGNGAPHQPNDRSGDTAPDGSEEDIVDAEFAVK